MTSALVRTDNDRDGITYAKMFIDYEHHEIHSGSHFFVSGFTTLADDASLNFGFETPAGDKKVHVTFEVSGTSQTEFYVYEDATYTGGTAVTPINNYRDSTNTSIATVVSAPTISDDGTQIFSFSKGNAGTTRQMADTEGFARREREIILKAGSKYVFRLTSRDDDNVVSYLGEWYEHTNK